jgi:hypothetical protein
VNGSSSPALPYLKVAKWQTGKPISEVFRQDPSYLTWFCNNVDGNEVLKRAIRALPGFSEASGKYFSQRKPSESQ